MSSEFTTIARNGLWDNNIVFGQLLALCPLLAVTGTATNGIGMGIATTAVLVASGLAVSLLRHAIPNEVRIPAFVLVIATLVTIVDLVMNAYVHELHKVLGLFVPLIVTNCAILGRAEAFASRRSPVAATVDGLMMGLGFTAALVVLGAIRELLGSGTLFANASLLFGERLAFLEMQLFPAGAGCLLLILPPGGFIVLGFVLALKAALERPRERTTAPDPAHERIERVFVAAAPERGDTRQAIGKAP